MVEQSPSKSESASKSQMSTSEESKSTPEKQNFEEVETEKVIFSLENKSKEQLLQALIKLFEMRALWYRRFEK